MHLFFTFLLSSSNGHTELVAPFREIDPADQVTPYSSLQGRLALRRICGPSPPTDGSLCQKSVLDAYRPQQTMFTCGLASLAVMLESLGGQPRWLGENLAGENREIDESEIYPFYEMGSYRDPNVQVPSLAAIQHRDGTGRKGVSLAQNSVIARNLPGLKQVHGPLYASDMTLEEFRSTIVSALANPKMRVILNYYKPAFGQSGGGHYVPVAAYCSVKDEIYIADISQVTPPQWGPVHLAFEAAQYLDGSGGRSRGLLVLELY